MLLRGEVFVGVSWFRGGLCACVSVWGDGFFGLVGAVLCVAGVVHSVVGLMLLLEYWCGHGLCEASYSG